jgi:hypothetical protein
MINWDSAQAWEKLNKAQEMLEEVRMEKLESTKNAMVVKLITIGENFHDFFLNFIKTIDHASSLRNCYMKDNLL